jgi:hypothetical protein
MTRQIENAIPGTKNISKVSLSALICVIVVSNLRERVGPSMGHQAFKSGTNLFKHVYFTLRRE